MAAMTSQHLADRRSDLRAAQKVALEAAEGCAQAEVSGGATRAYRRTFTRTLQDAHEHSVKNNDAASHRQSEGLGCTRGRRARASADAAALATATIAVATAASLGSHQ